MAKIKPLTARRDEVSKAIKSMSSDELIMKKLSYGEQAEGFRWELYRGTVPFWVDLMRFSGTVDLLVAYSVMFGIPDEWDEKREMSLYKYLLELNDFSQSWDTKFFLKEKTVILCASRSGEEINKKTALFLVDSFSRFAQKLSDMIAAEFPDLVRYIIKGDEDEAAKESEPAE